jgi:hypothetical protein
MTTTLCQECGLLALVSGAGGDALVRSPLASAGGDVSAAMAEKRNIFSPARFCVWMFAVGVLVGLSPWWECAASGSMSSVLFCSCQSFWEIVVWRRFFLSSGYIQGGGDLVMHFRESSRISCPYFAHVNV